MDYSCRDIPMRLDVRHQPLNFDIYLSQVIEVPITSLQEHPYDFRLENEALCTVDQIIERNQEPSEPANDCNGHNECNAISPNLVNNVFVDPPSCPTETPLTPIKNTVIPTNSQSGTKEEQSEAPIFNPRDFEDIHCGFDPFDHAELQTIDERRELDMIFQAASYSNQSLKK